MSEIGYTETDARLAVRIRAHTEYANFRLEDWLAGRLAATSGDRILEVGCGDGNYFPVYASKIGSGGLIVGFDVNDTLLAAAQRRSHQLDAPCFVFKWNFDNPFPILDHEFHCTLCPFAAYYAQDEQAWVDEVIRVTQSGGQILVLGPADDNARELYELNERVTGIGHIEETDFTTGRLERSFLPAFRVRLGKRVSNEILDRKIVFPTPREFARYYLATWLYEKTAERAGRQFSLEEVEQKVNSNSLSKRVMVLEARV